MELTGIGIENMDAFAWLMPGMALENYRVAIGAIEDERAVGVALYNDLGDALMLDYLYVAEEYRRRGIGTALIEDFLEEIKDTGAAALHVNYPELSEELHKFFLKLGFKLYRDGISYRASVKSFLSSKSLKKLLGTSSKNKVVPVAELNKNERQLLKRSMDKENLDPTTLDDRALSRSLSLATLSKSGDAPAACILCQRIPGTITILYMVNFSHDASQLIDIMRALKEAIVKEGYEDDELLFVTMSEEMEKFVKGIVKSDEILLSEGNVISGTKMIRGGK